jgi:hypothetical protein
VATALLYLNQSWPDTSDGCLRFLGRVDDVDSLVAPDAQASVWQFGRIQAFRQFVSWPPAVRGRAARDPGRLAHERRRKLRKTQRGKLSRLFKKLFGRIDRRWGAGRDKNAAHKD